MKSLQKTILYGFLLWLTVFAASFIIYPLKQHHSAWFETFIALILASATVFFGNIYFRLETLDLKSCLKVGFIWALVNIVVDIPLFIAGPFKMPMLQYFGDIGFSYLIIPIITTVYAYRR